MKTVQEIEPWHTFLNAWLPLTVYTKSFIGFLCFLWYWHLNWHIGIKPILWFFRLHTGFYAILCHLSTTIFFMIFYDFMPSRSPVSIVSFLFLLIRMVRLSDSWLNISNFNIEAAIPKCSTKILVYRRYTPSQKFRRRLFYHQVTASCTYFYFDSFWKIQNINTFFLSTFRKIYIWLIWLELLNLCS